MPVHEYGTPPSIGVVPYSCVRSLLSISSNILQYINSNYSIISVIIDSDNVHIRNERNINFIVYYIIKYKMVYTNIYHLILNCYVDVPDLEPCGHDHSQA